MNFNVKSSMETLPKYPIKLFSAWNVENCLVQNISWKNILCPVRDIKNRILQFEMLQNAFKIKRNNKA